MSSHSPNDHPWSRRQLLRWGAAVALAPIAARAGCPCGPDQKDQTPPPSNPAPASTVLRVCADPNNLPFSNRKHEGFEDKIAELVARELGMTLEYDWLPQRLGFYRTALKTFDSNLVMAAPAGFEKAMVTDPYYRSTYVFVRRKDGAAITSLDDPALRTARVGVQLTGGVNSPPAHALAKRKIIDNVTGFTVFDESDGAPGEKIVAAVASGEIDVAIAWGPQAGYFAKRQSTALDVTPVTPAEDTMGEAKMPFTYAICMAVRRPDKALRARINDVIARRRPEIDRILDEYAVPRLPAVAGTRIESEVKVEKR